MASKLLYLLMDWETINWLRCSQGPSNIHDGTFQKNSKINLKKLTSLAKRLILDAWLGQGHASAD